MIKKPTRGFTLVEILVSIAIIATLVGTSAVMAPKLLKKGQQTKVTSSMRQMGSVLTSYATDHSNRLPPPATRPEDSEAKAVTYWYMYLEHQLKGGELDQYTKQGYWKEKNKSIFVNPMHPKKSLSASSVGYGMNIMLAPNVAATRGDSLDLSEVPYSAVNTTAIRDAERIPIIMPHWAWYYKCDRSEAASPKFDPYLVNERFPVLFLDGHIEVLSPADYAKRRLDRVPQVEE